MKNILTNKLRFIAHFFSVGITNRNRRCQERKVEIQQHMSKTAQEVKLADEARSHLSMEVHQRTSKIEKLKKRYEIITLAMQTPDGEEEMSQVWDLKNLTS